MDGYLLEHNIGDGALYYYKVDHPNVVNDIPQMRSNTQQPPFRAGGNQVPFFLGVRGNCCQTDRMTTQPRSIYLSVLNK
jgi:hypothetical protein